MKSIYTFYKERLIEISGKNRSLYLKNFNKKNGYDVGKILYEDQEKATELISLLWNGNSTQFSLIGKETKDSVLKSSDIDSKFSENETFSTETEKARFDRKKREYSKKIITNEVQNLKTLKREIEEIEKETGRYELFFCYPFVFGSTKNYVFKAPLLMFPVVLDFTDDTSATISFKYGESIQLNKALMLAIADSNHLNLDELQTEFDSLSKFDGIPGLLNYLKSFGIKIAYQSRKNVFPFNRYSEPSFSDNLEIKNIGILSRCSLANAIYSDYSALEKKNLTNNSINELLNTKQKLKAKKSKQKNNNLYLVSNVDYAQQQVIQKVNENGNMVIYGPPGTGKSQTIVNIISDALCKNKKVLVVSQKKAALEVIYNRLSSLNSRAMFVTDPEKERRQFYTKCFSAHESLNNINYDESLLKSYQEIKKQLDEEVRNLEKLSECLTEKTEFGISLQEMYYSSYKIGKKSVEYEIYKDLINDKDLMALSYEELIDSLATIYGKNDADLYYNYIENKKKNPFIDHLKEDVSVHIIAEAQSKLKSLCSKRQPLFDVSKYKYSRQVLTYYSEIKNNNNITPLIKMIASIENPKLSSSLKASHIIFPMYPFTKTKMSKRERIIKNEINLTTTQIDEYMKEYEFLKTILTKDGYLMAADGILNGNSQVLKMVLSAVSRYIEFRDITATIKGFKDSQKTILNFAYKNTNTYTKYKLVLSKLLPIRIYNEIVKYEDIKQVSLSTIVGFENMRAKITSLIAELCDLSKKIANQCFVNEYKKLLTTSKNSKDYLYQIAKKQNYWPIRKVVEVYGDYIFKLFPCWLISPENVSTILPLTKDLFDIVLFDEASQVFIENTIPSIYRGKCVVVAGDAKQLRPTTTFMKRYMGSNVDDNMDYSTQAALEVESLLDLAVSRFTSTNINYHYRSKNEELIDFSNKAFYDNTLQIAPNVSKNIRHKPIERILVNGTWDDRKNIVEAKRVVDLIKTIIKTRKNNETIGIITFNVEQENCIEDLIDKRLGQDEEFRRLFTAETNRIVNGEDVSLFIKNLENVQGDERDIIIFSIGYAKNLLGKVNSTFGSLSNEGGENRLNVAITRAKQKIYVVTSVEPEELKIENAKFAGPKLLKSYLSYVRAVSEGNTEEVKAILGGFSDTMQPQKKVSDVLPIEKQIANKLNKLGYKTELDLGNSNSKISVAVYDKKHDKFLLGIETDQTVIKSSPSTLERDVFRNEFLKSRGWKIFRVWSRDWWHNASQVTQNLVKEIEKQEKLLEKSNRKPEKKLTKSK